MKPDDIDEIFAQVATPRFEQEGDASVRARSAILADLRPVQPMAPAWLFTLILGAVAVLMALGSAAALGMAGIRALSPGQRLLIFSLLLVTMAVTAAGCARMMRPASGRNLGPLTLALASVAFPALFALIFNGYGLAHFVPDGIPCLRAGLIVAIPTGAIVAFILRRGFVMEWQSAGLAAGVLAGLSGLGMLELHCANLKAIHVIVWHVAVVVCSALLGWVAGKAADLRRKRGTFAKT